MLSIPCTICPPSPRKNAPSLKSTNPVIAPRIIVVLIRQKSIACREAFKKLIIVSWLLTRGRAENRAGGNTPPKLHLVSTVDNGTKFPKNCRIILKSNILRSNRRNGPRTLLLAFQCRTTLRGHVRPTGPSATSCSFLNNEVAGAIAIAGEKDLAQQQLATASPTYGAGLITRYGHLKLSPFWDPLRGDPPDPRLFQEIQSSA